MTTSRGFLLGVLVAAAPATLTAQETPEGFKQLLQRGQIASVDAPVYVSAAEAEMPHDAWVLGAVIEGQAFAYSVNLLNSHEVVNDKIGDTAFAAVW
jgi:hypothetical protein